MPTFLVVGGCNDGRRLEMDKPRDVLRLSKSPMYEIKSLPRFFMSKDLMNSEEYVLTTLISSDGPIEVYVLRGENVMRKLVEGYVGHGY